MRKFYFGSVIIALSSLIFAACGGPAVNTNSNANTGSKNTATSSANSSNTNVVANSPAGTTVKPVGDKINDAPTLAPVVHAYYDALRTKNSAALKDVLSAAFLAKNLASMKEDGAKDLAAYMAEFDTVPDKPMQVRNERFDGDRASVELLGGGYGKWTAFELVKEDGKWKFTGGSSDLKAVKGQ